MPKTNVKRYTIEQNPPKACTGTLDVTVERTERNDLIRVLIVGDSHIVRSGLRKIIETEPPIRVLGEVSVRRADVDTISRYNPDLVLVDLDPRGADALGLISTCRESLQNSAVLILSDLAEHELAHKALGLGAGGIVLKMQPPAVLIAAIKDLCPASSDHPVQRIVTETREDRIKSMVAANSSDMLKFNSLTTREHEIIHLIALGLKNKEIAQRLSISDITVRHHLTSIFCKLEVTDRQKLLILTHRFGLADLALNAGSA